MPVEVSADEGLTWATDYTRCQTTDKDPLDQGKDDQSLKVNFVQKDAAYPLTRQE